MHSTELGKRGRRQSGCRGAPCCADFVGEVGWGVARRMPERHDPQALIGGENALI